MKVVVTGATGFIGRKLVHALLSRGDTVVMLARDPSRAKSQVSGAESIQWDTSSREGAWEGALRGAGAVVHLAGESINGQRWNEAYKRRILDSRVEGTRNLVTALARAPSSERPEVFVSASGVDYYGDTGEQEKPEGSPTGSTFLADVCVQWEREALRAREHGARVSCLRTGIVLGDGSGGALEKMLLPFKLFVGGPVGGGNQWFPWLHRDDMVAMYLAALDDPRYAAPFNAVTESVRMRDFARTLGTVLKRPSWAPVPKFALELAMGEVGALVAESKRIVPATLKTNGFAWRFPTLEGALRDVLAKG
jgi:uncharacterized protein (TIGR01777 family)